MILPKVRDSRFVTIRRGGTLTDSDHHLLALWAASCAEHVLDLFESAQPEDPRPRQAIENARAWVRGEVTMMHDAFADLTVVVEDTVVEGDKLAARVTWHGIHRGDFVGIPGTGAAVDMQSVQILKFTDGLATEWWGTADVFGALRQVGASVTPPT